MLTFCLMQLHRGADHAVTCHLCFARCRSTCAVDAAALHCWLQLLQALETRKLPEKEAAVKRGLQAAATDKAREALVRI